MIEMIIVLLVISVSFLIGQHFFVLNNKDLYQWEACIESIYGEITHFLQAAHTNKILQGRKPIIYGITFDPEGQYITLRTQTTWWQDIYQQMYIPNISLQYCKTIAGQFILTGQKHELIITSKKTGNEYILSGVGVGPSTWQVTLIWIPSNTTNTLFPLSQFETDIRIMNIKKKKCLAYLNNECEEWEYDE